MTSSPDPLVSTDWLARHLQDDALVVLDATYTLPGVTPTGGELYAQRHIEGARFFDIDAFADPGSSLPHMLPDPALAERLIGELGIDDDTLVVVYDTPGLMSAARAWWTLEVFGHRRVRLLDGGLRKWLAEGREVTAQPAQWMPRQFRARFRPELVSDKTAVEENLASHRAQLIDARSASRFTGAEAEKRPGLRAGHIPGSLNLAFDRLSDPATGQMLDQRTLRARFETAGLDWNAPVIASCGSGVTACALAFALYRLGKLDVAVYDGSWSQWGADERLPCAQGESTFEPGRSESGDA
ncbi:sulfurtransferase [Halotalea alkalilenta]|uniref:3-mercaptopyruvate sulfurtransferase n=1 Tax=Halotalea alkalilenta TaxID=376489 RepID=A0A172YG96_9GAMM|nr:sulfurtransferase [Halotalea alkalilenta]ANF58301.1 3-mercaptopyruvate sulfurtransferase [Halotalea alkalilenta]